MPTVVESPDLVPPAQLAREFDLRRLPPDFYENPFPYYAALRYHEPVKQLPGGGYLLTRYRDVEYVYKNPKLFSSDKKVEFKPKYGDSPLYEHHTTSLVFNDPPLHTRVRRLINGALVPRAIADLQPGLIALVDRLLAAMAEKRDADLIDDFASAIPVEIIGNLLVIPHEQRGPLRRWSLAILGALEPVVTDEVAARGNKAVEEFIACLDTVIAERRVRPGNPEHDVLTRLIQGEDQGERLSARELVHNCIFLLNAGHETTTNLIGNGLVALHDNPDQKDALLSATRAHQVSGRRSAAARELKSAGQSDYHAKRIHRCTGARRADTDHALHWRCESRSRAIRRAGSNGHHALAQPASRVRLRHSSMRRHEPGAARRQHRDRALSGTLPAIRDHGKAYARRTGAVPRLSEDPLPGRSLN